MGDDNTILIWFLTSYQFDLMIDYVYQIDLRRRWEWDHTIIRKNGKRIKYLVKVKGQNYQKHPSLTRIGGRVVITAGLKSHGRKELTAYNYSKRCGFVGEVSSRLSLSFLCLFFLQLRGKYINSVIFTWCSPRVMCITLLTLVSVRRMK